jgi:hypothetical protein
MLKFVTYSELRSFAATSEARSLEKAMKMRSFSNNTIFLSHSSGDHDLLPGIIQILENYSGNGRVYTDEKDSQLGGSDVTKTAERLRIVVKNSLKFVLFVTEKSRNSKWIPWELGLGDGNLNERNVALFPAAEEAYEQTWAEVEYLGLYKRIIRANFNGSDELEWMVYDHETNIGIRLRTWLT